MALSGGMGHTSGPIFRRPTFTTWLPPSSHRWDHRLRATGGGASAVDTRAAPILSQNRYDVRTHTLAFTQYEVDSYNSQIPYWKSYFSSSDTSRGLPANAIADPKDLKQVVSFFAWASWASVAHVPGHGYSYTNNFPYDLQAGNQPSKDSLLWSAMSFIALLAGIGVVLFAFGRFDYLGWKGDDARPVKFQMPTATTKTQRSTLKYFVVVLLMFLAQTLVGGAVSHFRADPKSFYGFDLASLLPSDLLRTWHLQLAIFWIATAYVAGGLFLASLIGKNEPKGQAAFSHILFGALVVVVAGSLLGELLGLRQLLGKLWFWLGDQGWEYLEIGRLWQYAMAVALLFWVYLLVRGVGKGLKDQRPARSSTGFFWGRLWPFLCFTYRHSSSTDGANYTVVDTWRFWIIHLWVEGFFELFATTMVAVMFFNLKMVTEKTAKRVIYLDAILFLGAGVIGTGHHWYWTGQPTYRWPFPRYSRRWKSYLSYC